MKQKAGSLKKINKIDKPQKNLTKMRRKKNLTKMRREKTQISKIRNKSNSKHQENPWDHQRLC
jgi:hypothetical protein